MKKILSILSILMVSVAYLPATVYADGNYFGKGSDYVDPLPNFTGNEETTVEGSPELWEKFLKYDLCITDYDSLPNDEKDLCRFIFETEQSSIATIRCERARRTLAHDKYIGERLTLETAMNSYGIWDCYSPAKAGSAYFTHAVPDIKYLDSVIDRNEYWLDDEGTTRIISTGEINIGKNTKEDLGYFNIYDYSHTDSFYDAEHDIMYYPSDDYITYGECVEAVIKFKKYPEENLITVDNITYGICPDNTLTVIDGTEATGFVEIPESIDNYKVTSIDAEAFLQADITDVKLPDTIEYINTYAFIDCENLKSINFPENLKFLGVWSFARTGLEEVIIDCPELRMNVEVFGNTPIKYADINATNIPSSIFYACDNLEYVHIGSCVEKIETDAFNYCTVKNIKISDGVKYIGLNAFNTKNKVVINLPDTVEIIGFLPSSTGYSYIGETGQRNAVNNLKHEYDFNFFNNNSIVYVYDNLYDILNPLKNRKNIRLFGDTNKDHKVNVSDAVLLQKYLHGKGYVGNEADLTRDGLIDSFDMVYMRKMILNNQ
ncbi:MAG: leucine-rich repeat protein [Ruminococcus sp.]|nr:leucine-rich repeat protein [Ruminococcus sp.]